MKIPNQLIEKIDKYLEENQDKPRLHMGASLLGHKCDRYLWLNFRWAVKKKNSKNMSIGRLQRIFRKGHIMEDLAKKDLENAGIVFLKPEEGKQHSVNFGSHVSGSVDGIILSGVPEAPNKKHIWENKSHNDKSFSDLVNNGVEKSQQKHYIQAQVYMYGLDIDRCLYTAENKNDENIYSERLRLDKAVAEKAVTRGKEIATSDRLPEPLTGAGATWYECKMCDCYDFCHKTKLTREINCRTCAHFTAEKNGTFTCARWGNAEIPAENQYTGCDSHVFHTDLVPWQFSEKDSTETSAAYMIGGKIVLNGDAGINSRDLLQLSDVVKVFEGEL